MSDKVYHLMKKNKQLTKRIRHLENEEERVNLKKLVLKATKKIEKLERQLNSQGKIWDFDFYAQCLYS